MSKADEMFFKTPFNNKTTKEVEGKMVYEKFNSGFNTFISFNHETKQVQIGGSIGMKELTAINEKVRELQWI